MVRRWNHQGLTQRIGSLSELLKPIRPVGRQSIQLEKGDCRYQRNHQRTFNLMGWQHPYSLPNSAMTWLNISQIKIPGYDPNFWRFLFSSDSDKQTKTAVDSTCLGVAVMLTQLRQPSTEYFSAITNFRQKHSSLRQSSFTQTLLERQRFFENPTFAFDLMPELA